MKKILRSIYEYLLEPMHHRLIRNTVSKKKIHQKRRGFCRRCGECCKIDIIKGVRLNCPLLWYDEQDRPYCRIHQLRILGADLRPKGCRLYPISPDRKHWFTENKGCGFYFEDEGKS